MTAFKDGWDLMVSDLKTSWYFRIYALAWGICFIFGFVAFIVFAKGLSQSGTNLAVNSFIPSPEHGGPPQGVPAVGLWFENSVPQIQFPNFQFQLPGGSTSKITNLVCSTAGLEAGINPPQPNKKFDVTVMGCDVKMSVDKCVQVEASLFDAYWPSDPQGTPDAYLAYSVNCVMNTTATANEIIDLNLLNATLWGLDSAAQGIWISNDNKAWVMLSKAEFASPTESGVIYPGWFNTIEYKSAVGGAGYYDITISLPYDFIYHYYNYGDYSQDVSTSGLSVNNMITIGFFGAFVGFLWILFGAFMFVVDIFLTNDSRFLGMVAPSPAAASGSTRHKSVGYDDA